MLAVSAAVSIGANGLHAIIPQAPPLARKAFCLALRATRFLSAPSIIFSMTVSRIDVSLSSDSDICMIFDADGTKGPNRRRPHHDEHGNAEKDDARQQADTCNGAERTEPFDGTKLIKPIPAKNEVNNAAVASRFVQTGDRAYRGRSKGRPVRYPGSQAIGRLWLAVEDAQTQPDHSGGGGTAQHGGRRGGGGDGHDEEHQ